ncbi:F-box protein [Apostasia shenzhenica]|uniref:F-box protein n=1 Tax=Apostasia shenzhenica TaxID=1088818 RepID=A0A2I0B8A8_9ASPA|nr:F-box protein [Apostasia shenzhenica]
MPCAFNFPTSPHLPRKKKRKKRTVSSSKEVQREGYEEDEDEAEEGFKLKDSACFQNHIIQPLGNLLLVDPSANIRNPGLGSLKILPDELLLDILGLVGGCELGILSSVSKSLYVFSAHEPLWRNLVLDELKAEFLFAGSWRYTYISTLYPHFFSPAAAPSGIRIRNFYSDYLFQSWLCANMEMKDEWLQRDNIERRRGLSVEEFVNFFEEINKPVLLEGCLDHWPAMENWSKEGLIRICKDVKFSVGPLEMTVEKYFAYAAIVKEERPLYLFDPRFAEKIPELSSNYEVPVYFREDLFSVLGKERPDYRWIIIGPAGSGSSFHVDPNSTSAWNAVIKGSKKWVMFPPEVVPPGVHPSPDGAEVASPVSIMEWFMNFYGACRNWKKRPIECVCKAGEVVFVPHGWWHLVINLEDSIAITQNYVSRRNLLQVLDFLKRPNARELVSGTEDRVNLHDKFRAAIEAALPGTVDQLAAKELEKMAQKKKLSFWESASDAISGGFRFSF